ncbi:hypothetical protein EJ06DRAFT_281948 [Trichodelitschia bisporula]|uniref:Uncharacterized protein n=1 Tax=Trichodelitschia bisporula TaxID=703511 RepID=A0A6G1I651_9PEZI|nr:hypothetical protein EJ06DRAFT_281948 [Trichodelitschia bisporula]
MNFTSNTALKVPADGPRATRKSVEPPPQKVIAAHQRPSLSEGRSRLYRAAPWPTILASKLHYELIERLIQAKKPRVGEKTHEKTAPSGCFPGARYVKTSCEPVHMWASIVSESCPWLTHQPFTATRYCVRSALRVVSLKPSLSTTSYSRESISSA